ncbi:replication initiation protein [Actinomadura chibensis]|uniref:Replication initiation protein n=2 Tax=Actinomadura chibensis TaxID=392828 RepID=A0A5D0NZU2_9ACTN|nr:replication initiation protein [Actinomadura chibensis]
MSGEVPPWLRAVAEVASAPGYERWTHQVAATGGCSAPVRLVGESQVIDQSTGEVVHVYRTADEPTGHLLVACGNRRASVCPACSEVYRRDVFHVIRSGLSGGKGIGEHVSTRPRVFATLTAPSFGAVHARRERGGEPVACRPRRVKGRCVHGAAEHCGLRHDQDDILNGQPICAECYDYVGAVLWQAHAGKLWHYFTLELRRELARLAGLSRRRFNQLVRPSFAKVAEYQRRGLVHFHAVIRLDGAAGHQEPPPDWATAELLTEAIPTAARRVVVMSPDPETGHRALGWGDQIDVRPIDVHGDGQGLSDQAVAGYIAKYATKGAEASGTIDRRLTCGRCKGAGGIDGTHGRSVCKRCAGLGTSGGLDLDRLPVTAHARRMIRTCWDLGALPDMQDLRLRPWAHMLGFRGHFATKSRHYSITLGTLRQDRADHRAAESRERHGLPAPDSTLVLAHWRFAGQGYTDAEQILADHIGQRAQTARRIAAERAEEEGCA